MPLVKHNGLEILVLSGDPEAMGQEHGYLMRERIQRGMEGFVRKSGEAFGVPFDIIREISERCEAFIPDRYLREMRALAEACGVPYRDILALNCLVDADACYMQQLVQCCNFVLSPPATKGDLLAHGRNLDFPPFGIVPDMSIVIWRTPSDPRRLPTLAITWVGFVGTLTGMNSARITAAEVGVPARDSSPEGTPVSLLLREALEISGDLNQFSETIRSAPRTGGFNLAVSDGKSTESRAIEYTHTMCETRKPRRGVLVVDDVCLCKNTARNRLSYPAGAFRHARMMQLVTQDYGAIDLPRVLDYLKDRYDMAYAVPRGVGYNCICNYHTVQSVLFLPSEARLYVAQGQVPAPRGEYCEIRLDDLTSVAVTHAK